MHHQYITYSISHLVLVLHYAENNCLSANRQRKYAEVPAPPVAQVAPTVRREQRSGLRPLPTAADADKIFAAYGEAETDLNRDWVNKKK